MQDYQFHLERLGLFEIPEAVVLEASKVVGETSPENSFRDILNICKKFKDAGMTPIIVTNITQTTLAVTAKETFGKKLH